MRKKKKTRFWAVIMVAVLIYFTKTVYDQQKVIWSYETKTNEIAAKKEEEVKQNQVLKEQKEMINTDEYVEKIAREKLGMVKPGEKVIVDINK